LASQGLYGNRRALPPAREWPRTKNGTVTHFSRLDCRTSGRQRAYVAGRDASIASERRKIEAQRYPHVAIFESFGAINTSRLPRKVFARVVGLRNSSSRYRPTELY